MDFNVVGVDGGATKVRAGILDIDLTTMSVKSVSKVLENTYDIDKKFNPIDISIQLDELKKEKYNINLDEEKQGNLIIEKIVFTLKDLLKDSNKKVLIGLGMPGLKSKDGRGIVAMANGPRIPNLAKILENNLKKENIILKEPIYKIGSDADFCGIGEEYSCEGKFRKINTAYYLGIGTGVADAMKIEGEIIPFDKADWIAKTWQIKAKDNASFENFISMSGIKKQYLSKNPNCEENIHVGIIMDKALKGETIALEIIEKTTTFLAELIFERIHTLALGSYNYDNLFNRKLNQKHKFLGKAWQKIILGQRLGKIWNTYKYKEIFHDKIYQYLNKKLHILPKEIRKNYIENEEFNKNIIVGSELTLAPVIGAGISALKKEEK